MLCISKVVVNEVNDAVLRGGRALLGKKSKDAEDEIIIIPSPGMSVMMPLPPSEAEHTTVRDEGCAAFVNHGHGFKVMND